MRHIRAVPSTLPALAATLIIAWWVIDGGGFAIDRWAPGGLALLGLLSVALLTSPIRWAALPRSVAVAVVSLAGYTLWSFASIGWADDRGFAWEGAGRTAVYLVVFCLFALWPQRPRTAGWLLGALVGATVVAALVTVTRLVGDPSASSLLGTGRLQAPTGYPNATACLMLLGLFPALVLAGARETAWWARGGLTVLVVVLAGVALLAVSRGALYASPAVLLVLLAVAPNRVSTVLLLVPLAVGLLLATPRLLAVGEVAAGGDLEGAVDAALLRLAWAALATGAVVAAASRTADRARERPGGAPRVRAAARWAAIAVMATGLAGGVAVIGNPVTRAEAAWQSFKGGYEDNSQERNRLVGGLGSSRYDFYRVGLRSFADHPLVGIGADNFYQPYLRLGRSTETPRYPHSLQIRTLEQTGVVGAVLLLWFLLAAGCAVRRALSTSDPWRASIAAAAAIGVIAWAAHGSLDWFWEWAGLSALAFALAGLTCSLAPREKSDPPATPGGLWRAGVVGLTVVAAVPLASLWTADAERLRAAQSFASAPDDAYGRLRRAAALNPFGAAPATLEGSVAIRLGDLARADAAFGRALERVPDDQYATLERGAVASARGDRRRAIKLLARASALAPRDGLSREALQIVRDGGQVDVAELNRRILDAARPLAG